MKRTSAVTTGNLSFFYAFLDGVFQYVCAECDALCCRGQGFGGSLKREMQTLVTLYPSLGSMAVSREGNILSFATPAGRCFFLDSDNLCRIEKEHGKALKPGVCMLFPFNVFTRIGNVIAVSPHFMCPLRLSLPARPGEVEGTHSLIETAVLESGLLDNERLKTFSSPTLLHPSQDAASVLEREEKFRDASSRSLGLRTFVETLKDKSADPLALDDFLAQASRIMGLEAPDGNRQRDAIDDLLLALASPFRLLLLTLSAEAILRALALGELVVRQASLLSGSPLTLQGAHQILNTALPVLKLLARDDCPPREFQATKMKSAQFADPEMTFAAFTFWRGFGKADKILPILDQVMTPSLSVADRAVLLRHLGAQTELLFPKYWKKKDSRSRTKKNI